MKKYLSLFVVILTVLISCSSEDNSTLEEVTVAPVLPKTISYIYPNVYLGTNSTSAIKYDGNKILSSTDGDAKTKFTYAGDFIAKQEIFDKNETKVKEVAYTYENGKLKTRILKINITSAYPEGQFITKTVYTHNSNEQISYINYSVDKDTKVETKSSEGSLTYKDGNLVKEQQKENSTTITLVYEYDTKFNSLNNILGFNSLLNETAAAKNNIVKTTKTSTEFTGTAVYLRTYSYNESGYPLKQSSFVNGGQSIEYEIEYTY